MTAQNENAIAERDSSHWQNFVAGLRNMEEAMAYDPQETVEAVVLQLTEAVARLEARVIELESRDDAESLR